MQIDSATLYLFIKELKKIIVPAQVRQIHQIDNRIMDMELFCPNSRPVHLIFNTHTPPIVYLTTKRKGQNQYDHSQTFCMTLRKHLEGSRLSHVEQIEMDRILAFSFDRIEAAGAIVTKTLWVELLPASPNLILTEGDTIIDACLRGKKLDRLLIPGETYKLPDNTSRMDFMKFSKEELKSILDYSKQTDTPLDTWIFHTFNGFSRFLVDELASLSHIPSDIPLPSLTDSQEENLLQTMHGMQEKISTSKELHIYEGKNGKHVVSPIPLSILGEEKETAPIISWMEKEALSSGGTIASALQEYRKKIHTLIKREERKQRKIQEEMAETEKTEQYKLWGNLLSIYAYEKINGKKSLKVQNLFNDPPTEEVIPVDPLLSVMGNSQVYFKKYNKMKTRLVMGQEKLDEGMAKIQYLQDMLYFIDKVKTKKELEALKDELKNTGIEKLGNHRPPKVNKKSHKGDPALTSLSIDGFTVFMGKNSTQNEFLTLHKAKKGDLWFHARAIPGSHVVLETGGETIPESTLEKVAALTAWNSTGKDSGKVDVDYTLVRYVKKIPNGPPGLVHYTHQKTIVAIPTDIKE